MALVSGNVRSGITGALYVNATEAGNAPTSHNSALHANFKELGYVSEDGVTESRDMSTSQLKAWQNGAVLRENVTEANYRYSFVLLETKKETVELFYGQSVTDSDGSIVIVPGKTGGRKSFVIDIVDGAAIERTYIPSGEVTEVGDKVYKNDELVGYEMTITAYPHQSLTAGSDTGNAKKWYSTLVVTP